MSGYVGLHPGGSFIDGIISRSQFVQQHGWEMQPNPIPSYGGRATSAPTAAYDMGGRLWYSPMHAVPSHVVAPLHVGFPASPVHSHLSTMQSWQMKPSISDPKPLGLKSSVSPSTPRNMSPMRQTSPMRQKSPMRQEASRANNTPKLEPRPRSVLNGKVSAYCEAGTTQNFVPVQAPSEAPPKIEADHQTGNARSILP